MTKRFYDLHVMPGKPDESARLFRSLSLDGACVVRAFDSEYKAFSDTIKDAGSKTGYPLFSGAFITAKNPEEVQKKARASLECGADLVLIDGGNEEINRAASECWEVDVICHPERAPGKDLLDQKNSGLDDVAARYMAERGIAIEICLAELLSCYGVVRAQVMGRMRQNIRLARKYETPIILTSGASDRCGMRAPQDMCSLGISLGMEIGMAKAAVSAFPEMLIKKAVDRRDPDILLAGLKVVSWGGTGPEKNKKMFGWY